MEIKFENIEGRSIQFYLFMSMLAVLAIAGILSVLPGSVWVTPRCCGLVAQKPAAPPPNTSRAQSRRRRATLFLEVYVVSSPPGANRRRSR